ncbi:MAG: hydroxyethylthiazole kinase-like uncharacterized protein yjeF [Arenicella sp.]|jgi:hydroxyethylthiazole kinase-like uncharacterized protein yjeF
MNNPLIGRSLFTGIGAKQIDQIAINEFGHKGLDLMTRAGQFAFHRISQRLAKQAGPIEMLLMCGPGNNGGDGYVIGRCALEARWTVKLLAFGAPKSADARQAAELFKAAGGDIASADSLPNSYQPDVVVDALLGVGISGVPRAAMASAIETANKLDALKVAIDVPSGVDADTGFANQQSFRADLTISFIVEKIGLRTGPAMNYAGDIAVDDLGIDPQAIRQVASCANLLQPSKELRNKLLRQPDSHKGSYGHVVIAGGDNGMLGAALLAGRAALRCGSGKVHILSTEAHLDMPALCCPEIMSQVFIENDISLVQQASAVVLGPGLGLVDWGQQVFNSLINLAKPMVIDADALSLLSKNGARTTKSPWVLTPHPGEAARLLGCSNAEIQKDRLSAALEVAKQYDCVCVLKGAGTLIAGGGDLPVLCDRGNAGMASAGMGDVLSGMIAGFIGLGIEPRQAAELAVYLHACAADEVVQSSAQASLIASDVINQLPLSLRLLIA